MSRCESALAKDLVDVIDEASASSSSYIASAEVVGGGNGSVAGFGLGC